MKAEIMSMLLSRFYQRFKIQSYHVANNPIARYSEQCVARLKPSLFRRPYSHW